MRIIHVICSTRFAGVERLVTYVAPELTRRGHDVTVIGGAPEHMARPVTRCGAAFLPSEGLAATIRAIRSLPIDATTIVHSHMTAADLASVVSRPKNRPIRVSTLHFAQPRGRSALRRRLYRALPAYFDAQVAISNYVASRCDTTTTVVPNGIPDMCYPRPLRLPVVLMAQRLDSEKETRVALDAWAMCSLRHEGWQLQIAGVGSEAQNLSDQLRRLGIEQSVRLLGFVDDVPALMSSASIFLATAPEEPFGLAVVEAMAAGLPVLAATGGGHSEILADTGRQFRAGDRADCARRLTALAADAEERNIVVAAQRRRYAATYTIERHVDALLGVYEMAQQSSRSAAPSEERVQSW